MKRITIHRKSAVVFLVLVMLVGLAVDESRKIVRFQTAAMTPAAPGAEMLNGSYDTMITTFAATTTR